MITEKRLEESLKFLSETDEDNAIYLGIIMIILSVLICFFNISRTYGHSETGGSDTKS